MEKLIIHHEDGTETEVEPMQMWQPYWPCKYVGDCKEPATWLYKNFKVDKPIPVCDHHTKKINEGKTGILLRMCPGHDDYMLDYSMTSHKYHCPKCNIHLTSLMLCCECGTRYNIGVTAKPLGL